MHAIQLPISENNDDGNKIYQQSIMRGCTKLLIRRFSCRVAMILTNYLSDTTPIQVRGIPFSEFTHLLFRVYDTSITDLIPPFLSDSNTMAVRHTKKRTKINVKNEGWNCCTSTMQ
jgi:hypothetical protein